MSKVFIITGTRKGLGKELSMYYLANGNKVVGCSRGESDIQDTNYTHHSLDVSDEKAVMKLVRDTKKQHGCINVLINNAGIASMNHFTLTPIKTLNRVFDTNVVGTFLFAREVAKVMMRQKSGRIVNYSTVATPLRLEGEAVYAASKAAIESFTEIMARELGDFGITVNSVGPTPVPTDLIKNVPQEKMQELLNRQAIKRFGTFKDVLNVINFFINDSSKFITAQTIYLGGVVS